MRSMLFAIVLALAATACGPQPPASTGGTDKPTDLTASEMRSYGEYLQRFSSPCDDGETIATCLDSPGSCRACFAAAEFVAQSVRSGFVTAEVEGRYLARFDSKRALTIDVAKAPTFGPKGAAVTIVEFADFECPFCAAAVPVVDGLIDKYAPHVRLVFKHFPVKHHRFAELSARAAVAAHKQGKFWELHRLMFHNQERLDGPDIDKYARSLNFDMAAFKREWDAPQTAAVVNADYEQGDNLQVRGTPAFFINGRPFDFDLFDFRGEDLPAWIEVEIELATGRPYKE